MLNKAVFLFLINFFFSSISFAQYFTQFFGMASDSNSTYLFYRTNTQDPGNIGQSFFLYKYNIETMQETVFQNDMNYSSGGSTKVYTLTKDIEFINNQPDKYIITRFSDSRAYYGLSLIIKNGITIFSTGSAGLNIEKSEQNPSLFYVSAVDGFRTSPGSPDKKKDYLIKSTDEGISWVYKETDFYLLSVNKNDYNIKFGFKNNKLVIAENDSTFSNKVVDSVYNWVNYYTKFYYSSDRKHIYTTAVKDKSKFLLMSDNNGYTWKSIIKSDDTLLICLDKERPGNLYYSVKNNIYYSSDYGNSFTLFNALPENIIGICKKNNSSILYAVTDNKRYKVTQTGYDLLLSSTLDVKENHAPADFSLSQNYPNPFNPTTKIKYFIEKEGFVSLKVYDLRGTEITTLVNEKQRPGNYTVTFNAGNLPSGIYFYRLISSKSESINKMCLIK